jgi:hypothetical protein
MSFKLYVGNLSFKTSSEDLQQLFQQAGVVEEAFVIEDRETGRSRGFGFVEMATQDEAQAAIAQFNGKELRGRSLTVQEAQQRERGRGARVRHGRPRFGGRGVRASQTLPRWEVEAKVAGKQAVNYLAQQSAERVVIIATGYSVTDFEPGFLETPVAAFPPEYRLIHEKPHVHTLQSSKDFMAYISFPADQKIDQVVVYDEDGRHVIAVSQVMERESISHLFVNRTCIPVQWTRINSLTPDACKEFDLDSIDMNTSQSDFNEIKSPLIRSDTYSLIYFVPGEVELTAPILATTCLRLTDVGEGNTLADVLVYDQGDYKRLDYQFPLNGVLGCTAVANLGFCLLKSLHGITTRALSTITITDRAWMDKYEQFDLKVADDPIFDFCKSEGIERLRVRAADNECQSWTECEGQSGIRCFHNKAVCK